MNYFLIDYENVQIIDKTGFGCLRSGDMVIVMRSENCKNISLDIINALVKKNVIFTTFTVSTGTKNALDFQLSSYLGYLIGTDKTCQNRYYIVSKDKGYDAICKFWTEQNKSVKRMEKLGNVVKTASKSSKKTSSNELSQYLLQKEHVAKVLKIVNSLATKQAIHSALSKEFKEPLGTEMYRQIRPLLKQKNK